MSNTTQEDFKRRSTEALSIPAQTEPPQDSFLLDPRAVRRWAEELPVANIGETARQVYNTLVTFNRIRIPTLIRTEVIETFREPVRYINTNIARHYYNTGFPLSSRARKAAQLTAALCDEVANAYKILFLDQILADDRNFNQNLVIVAAQRALRYIGQKIYHSMLVYRDYPEGAWREANYLYAWAAQNGVHQVPVKESRGFLRARRNARSIESLYKALLLLATTNPYRLRQSQIRRIHERCQQWADLASLRPAHETRGNTGLFFINLWDDRPPRATLDETQRRDARFVALDLNAVVDEARNEFENSDWESPAYLEKDQERLSRSLLRPLIRTWTKSLERKYPRTAIRTEIEAIVGLDNLFRLLEAKRAAEAAEAAQEKKAAHEPTESLEKLIGPSSRLTWNDSVFSTLAIQGPASVLTGDSLLNDSKAIISTLLGSDDNDLLHAPKPKPMEDPFNVLTYNQSVEGYCLSWRKSYPMRVRVGDVLGIRSPEKPDDYGIAVTRWIKHHSDTELYLGLQILAPTCTEVKISTLRSGGSADTSYRCLLLSNSDDSEHEQTLLTNAHVFKPETELLLTTEFGQHRIRLTRWIESNNNFVHYQFEYVDAAGASPGSEEDQSRFDDLWSEL